MTPEAPHIPHSVAIDRWPRTDRSADATACDHLVLMLPKPLAGFGTARQLDCLARAVGSWSRVVYVGPPVQSDVEMLRTPFEPIALTESVGDTYRHCAAALTTALRRLLARGCRHPALVSLGYTAFGPEAAKRSFRTLQTEGLEGIEVFIVDSALPDRDDPERQVDADGWPLTRFHEDSYASDGVTTTFLLTSAYSYDPRILADRVPPVGQVKVIAPPYTNAYVEGLARAAADGRAGGLREFERRWPPLAAAREGDLLVPLVSSDIWSPSSVGAWMNQREYESVLTGTRMVLEGLSLFARQRGSTVFVPVDAAAEAELNVAPEQVVLLPYSGIPQDEHTRILGASDLAISRTGGQSNAFIVLAVAETPAIVVDLPDEGYMQAELTSIAAVHDVAVSHDGKVSSRPRAEPLAYLARWDWTPERFAALLHEAARPDGDAAHRAAAARSAFDSLRGSAETSLLRLLANRLGEEESADG